MRVMLGFMFGMLIGHFAVLFFLTLMGRTIHHLIAHQAMDLVLLCIASGILLIVDNDGG